MAKLNIGIYDAARDDYEGATQSVEVDASKYTGRDGAGEFGMEYCYELEIDGEIVAVWYSEDAHE